MLGISSFNELQAPMIIGIIWVVLIYPLPMVVAYVRHHQNHLSILLVNLLTGWTVVGWIVAQVWALTRVEKEESPIPQKYERPIEPRL